VVTPPAGSRSAPARGMSFWRGHGACTTSAG
jgi:hypothetical protein